MKPFFLILLFSFSICLEISAQWNILNSKSIEQYEKGNFEQSIIYANDALRLAENSIGKVSEEYVTSLSNLAYAQSGNGDYLDALRSFLGSLDKSLELYDLPHISQVEASLELSKTYVSVAKYDSSEYYLNFATQVFANVYKQNKIHYDSSIGAWNTAYIHLNGTQAVLLHRKGQVKQAIAVLETTVKEIKRLYPNKFEELSEYSTSINNLSVYHNEIGDPVGAKTYAFEYEILISNNGDTLDRIYALQNLGSAYRYLQNDSANFYWLKAIRLIEDSMYKNQNIHAIILNNLGEFALDMEMYNNAISFLTESLQIQKSKQTINPRIYKTTLFNLAESYHWDGNYARADALFKTLIDDIVNDIEHNFTFLSDNEKMAFYNAQVDVIEAYTSFALEISGLLPLQDSDTPYISEDVFGRLYDLQLQTKAIILNASKRMKQRILNSKDTMMIANYHLWEQRKNQLAKALLNGHMEDHELEKLKVQIEENEKWLTVNSRSFTSGFIIENVHWKDVQKALKHDEAAVEIIRFLDGLIYGALIVTPDTKEKPELALIMSTRSKHLDKQFYNLYRNSIALKLEDTLSYDTYWKPIKQKLLEVSPKGEMPRKIYLSNDGVYNQINVNTLYDTHGKQYVIDETEVVLLTNTKDLLVTKPNSKAKKATLFGQPTFSMSQNAANTFSDLPGTGIEVQRVGQILGASGWDIQSFIGLDATENHLKSVVATKVLHLASHGFFENNTMKEQPGMVSAMIQSGIALVGANDLEKTGEDGLLTAFEVLSMNLDSTQLVVLSACETGKGSLGQSEGVYGLQRAVWVAGASNMIMSLWKVNDLATQELMVTFYDYWVDSEDMDIHAAFRSAQQELREKYPEPYYWGAFVVAGK